MTFSPRRLLVLTFVAALCAGVASAQTTLTLGTPDTHVSDATISAGTGANVVTNNDRLTARTSTDVNATRRALLKFDTSTTIAAGTTITSAKLTLVVQAGGGAATRRIGIFPVTATFQEAEVTWVTRKSGYKWVTAGGDLATKAAEITVPATPGTVITVDVTAAVQRAIKDTSSRYTRFALIDIDAADSTSWREFYSSEALQAATRPKLEIVYGAAQVAPPPPPPPSDAPTGSTLKVLHWNIHRGWGTDNKYDLDRIATWIVKINPHIVSLNEVERYTSYANEDQPLRLQSMLRAKTGAAWYVYYRTGTGATNGHGNAILSRFPIASTSYCQLSSTRVLANTAVTVNGRLVNFYSTHLDSSSTTSTYRIAEVKKLTACVANDAEQKIIGGDFNAKYYTTEIGLMTTSFIDTWAKAAAEGTAVSYPGNTSFGATRNSRIDYVFVSKTATFVVLKKAEVIDTRDASGYMPSDHKPLVVTFEVR